jgi:hypothetical protein
MESQQQKNRSKTRTTGSDLAKIEMDNPNSTQDVKQEDEIWPEEETRPGLAVRRRILPGNQFVRRTDASS